MLQKKFGISANALRMVAMATMLLDHMYHTIIPGNLWLNCVGRITFPIFAFQIAEGFVHTSDRRRYAKRLALAALISEIPFDLAFTDSIFFPFKQNTIFTLLLGLAVIWALDRVKQQRTFTSLLTAGAVYVLACAVSVIGMTDYRWAGVTLVAAFYVFRDFRGAWIFQFAVMYVLQIMLGGGQVFPISLFGSSFEFPLQGFAMLALPFIWLYNGEKGRGGRAFQLAAYVFYPAHLLLLNLAYHLLP